MNVPIINGGHRQPQQPSPVAVNVGVVPPGVVLLEISYNGGLQVYRAPMDGPTATQTIINIGNAIEQLAPGQLEPILRKWLSELTKDSITLNLDGLD